MSILGGVTTRDILAVLIVGAALVFNGISLLTGKPLDPTTVGLAGVVVGYYFRTPETAIAVDKESKNEPLPEPFTGEQPG
jgi:hypothetical protein